jgi:hypothetical protein
MGNGSIRFREALDKHTIARKDTGRVAYIDAFLTAWESSMHVCKIGTSAAFHLMALLISFRSNFLALSWYVFRQDPEPPISICLASSQSVSLKGSFADPITPLLARYIAFSFICSSSNGTDEYKLCPSFCPFLTDKFGFSLNFITFLSTYKLFHTA